MNFFLRLLFGVFFSLSLSFVGFAEKKEPKIRVLLAENANEISIHSHHLFQFFGAKIDPNLLQLNFRRQNKNQIEIGRRWVAASPFYLASAQGMVFKNHNYRGLFEIHASEKGLQLINSIPLEDYVRGVVCSESSPSWPIEALKTQAVLARSFALYNLVEKQKKTWQIGNSFLDQVYKGKTSETPKCDLAVQETFGRVVVYQNNLIPVYYHANSGGNTENPKDVWNVHLQYLDSRVTPYGKTDPNYYWEYFISQKELRKNLTSLGLNFSRVHRLWIEEFTHGGRAKMVGLEGDKRIFITGEKLRNLVGYQKVKSTKFRVQPYSDGFLLSGEGSGHGVGYCQWCGKEMAAAGYHFQDIIQAFYQEVDIIKAYP